MGISSHTKSLVKRKAFQCATMRKERRSLGGAYINLGSFYFGHSACKLVHFVDRWPIIACLNVEKVKRMCYLWNYLVVMPTDSASYKKYLFFYFFQSRLLDEHNWLHFDTHTLNIFSTDAISSL